jgi:hypothetical protein
MGILSSIKDKLFGTKTTAATTATPAKVATSATTAAAAAKAAAVTPAAAVDVEAVIDGIVKAKGVRSNWRVSIVDLLNALDLPSSLAARKELAKDLNYTGTDPDGSAEKNTWLIKAVLKNLAENGGKISKDLLK